MYRKTFVEINENYIEDNVKNIIFNYPKYKYYFGVVKANAYGHGEHVVNAMISGGINYLAVSSLEEALSIRNYNKDIPIICFGYIAGIDLKIALKANITVSIISYEHYKEIIENKDLRGLKLHLKINSGMNRYGINSKDQVKEIVDNLIKSDFVLEGIYTHYATSGVADVYWDRQTKKFEELTSLIDLDSIPIVHLYNSLCLVKHEKQRYANGVRMGIVMYGYSSSAKELSGLKRRAFDFKKYINTGGTSISRTNLSNNLKLKKALSLYSEVVNINFVKAGEPVGYRANYIPANDSFIAVIPIGHGDGVTKFYEFVKINNKKYPIVALCMDAIMVRVDEKVNIHDKVTIIGDDIQLIDIANYSGITISEALVSISNRIPRVHIYNNEVTEIKY